MLKEIYQKEVISVMKEKFGYKSLMAVPRIEKVVVNVGFGKFVANKGSDEQRKFREHIAKSLSLISGQKPIFTKAKKAIATFKIRKDQVIGVKATLRKKRMYDFLERLVNIVLPRSRDFRGISKNSINEKGNLTIGLKEHIVFPEISPEEIKFNFGLEVSVVTSAKNKKEGMELFKLLGFPIQS